MRNRFGWKRGLFVLCAVIICMLTACICTAEETDYSIQGPYTWWDGMTIPDNEACNELLGELYYHVGVWEDADGSGHTLMIENNSMTGLDYSLTAYFPARGTIEFNYLTVEPSGKYVIFYDENGDNEAHVYLPFNGAPYAQFFSKDSSWQTEMGEWVYSYTWLSTLPGATDRDPLNAWVEDWYCTDGPAELSIRHEGRDDGLHVQLTLAPGVVLEFNITDQHDYEIIENYSSDGIYLYMFLNAYCGGRLELQLEADTPTAQAFAARTGINPFSQEMWFMTEVPPDLTLYGWTPDLGENQEEMARPAPERLTATEDTPYAIYGPVTTWDGKHPEDRASYEALCEFSAYTGTYNGPDGTSVTFAEPEPGSNKYTMRAYFPDLGTLELDYMTTGPDARYLIFYSVDGDFEAHVYYSFVSSPYVRYYWKGSVAEEQIGTGIYRYDNGQGLPAAYFSDWAALWTGNWAEIGGTSEIRITRNGDGTLHLYARFDPSLEIEDDFATDQYDCYFRIMHTTADGLEYSLFIDEEDGGKLEFYPWATGIYENSRYYPVLFHKENGEIYPYQYAYKLSTGAPAADIQPEPDQTEDITIVIYRKLVFGILRYLKLQASSGAGAWEGTLEIDSQGRFTGEYTDSDDDQVYTVSFSGTFGKVRRVTASTYILTVTSAATEKTPGTEWDDEYGIHYVCEDTLLPEGSQWLLTLPGTALGDIPEMVQGEITGTYGDEADPRNFITLTDLQNGWGFFVRVKEDKQKERVVYPDRSNPFNGSLFRNKSSVFDLNLALAAATLSYEIEDRAIGRMRKQLNKYDLGDHGFYCYDFSKNTYQTWNDGGDAAFAFGQKIISVNAPNDTTIITVIGRGTQNWHWKEALADWIRQGAGDDYVAGHYVLTSISAFAQAMWDAFNDYLKEHPIQTDNVKILVTGHSLGGAMANMFGARLTYDLKKVKGLKGKIITQDDIYVYTFGAIKVLQSITNASEGYENIHNVYYHHDSFGPGGNLGWLNVSSAYYKFGHTELFYDRTKWKELRKSEFGFSTNNHNMPLYIEALQKGYVHCSLTPDTSGKNYGSGKDGSGNTDTGGRTIRRVENYSEIWVRRWFLNGDRNSTIDITLNENGTLHVVVHIYLILDFEFDVAPTDFEFLMFTDESGRIIGYLILGDDGTLYLYIDPDSPIMDDRAVSDYLRDHPLFYTADDPPVLQPDPDEPDDTDTPEFGPSVPASDGTVILDDEYITVIWLDEAVSVPSREGGEAWPYYRLAFTNRLDIDIIIHLGFAGGEGGWGTVDGIPLRDLLIYFPDGTIIGDNLVIPAGSTIELIFRPVGGGYGYRTAEDLINVIVRFHLRFRNETRDYELPLDTGESPVRLSSNETIRYDAIRFGFSFRIPANWLVIDGDDMIRILPPPYLAGTLEDIIQITFGWDGLRETLDASEEYIRQDGVTIGGRPADIWRGPTSIVVIIRLGNGTEVVIIIRWEEPYTESVRPLTDDFLDSIEYTTPEGEEPASEPEQSAEETQPEQPAEETQPEQPAEETPPEQPAEEIPPEQPAEEMQPEQPAEETQPEQPAEETQPEQPAEEIPPEQPAEETQPEQPTEETQPEQPAEETPPEQPTEEIQPEQPAEEIPPEQPAEETPPEQPAEVTQPEAPAYTPGVALEPIYGRPGKYKVPVMTISATGYIVNASNPYMFIPENMLDGIDETCWQFSTKDIRLGDAYIYINFSAPVDLDELWMKNGFWKITNGYDQYIRNCRIKKMEIDFRYEGDFSYTDGFTVQLNDDKARRDWTVISLGGKTRVTGVRIRVMDVYRGEKFKNDVAVSDIMFVQNDK